MTYGLPSIYLDHAATTPTDPDVVQAMLPYFTATFGNPSSIYQVGQDGHAALDRARRQIAQVLGARPSEIVFTSGATESNNLALKGVAWAAKLAQPDVMPHVVVSAIEHHAVLHAAEALGGLGFEISVVPCDASGLISPDAIAQAIRPSTCLVSVMYANNEVGTIQPIAAIAEVARQRGIPFHTDAVQAAGVLSTRCERARRRPDGALCPQVLRAKRRWRALCAQGNADPVSAGRGRAGIWATWRNRECAADRGDGRSVAPRR